MKRLQEEADLFVEVVSFHELLIAFVLYTVLVVTLSVTACTYAAPVVRAVIGSM